ncbi:MAG TPA: class I SAM-dependent methyltransferase, partial [Chthonomonadales bacterium]|nr:class I SAM-dependent methyltransferase [Chthonomonadales bacterium]
MIISERKTGRRMWNGAWRCGLAAACAAVGIVLARSEANAQAVSQNRNGHPAYTYKAVHDPDGIGKFYMGREIAQVIGHEAADWLDRPERSQEEAPDVMVAALKLRRGETVADIGAGSGYISFKLARMVGGSGRVYAEDIQPEMLRLIEQKMRARHVTNVTPVLGNVTDTRLKPGSLDLALLVDVYHEFDHPWEMTRSIVRALKPGGALVLVEYRLEDPNVPIKLLHKMSVAQVRKEMAVQPLKYSGTSEVLPWQHIIRFTKLM